VEKIFETPIIHSFENSLKKKKRKRVSREQKNILKRTFS